jgi:hypothetical protein
LQLYRLPRTVSADWRHEKEAGKYIYYQEVMNAGGEGCSVGRVFAGRMGRPLRAFEEAIDDRVEVDFCC